MANIGSFKKSGGEFQGEIVTLRVQTNAGDLDRSSPPMVCRVRRNA
jgi:uncharacterized protein (DUF736 family)